jgi:hypothetical protein
MELVKWKQLAKAEQS